MYESGETSFLDIIFSSSSMQDMLNKADYVEKMHEYDKKVFVNYQIARQNVETLKETLEIEESELEAVQEGLEEERVSVEEARSELEAISADYAVQISKAKQQAEIYKTQIKQRNAQIKKIEEEERRKAEEERKRKEEEERKRKEEEERKRREEEAKKNSLIRLVMRTVTRLPPMIMVPKWLLERTQSHRQTEAPKAKKLQTMLVDLWETPMWQAARASQKGRIVLALRSLSTRHLATAFRETRLPSGASGKR